MANIRQRDGRWQARVMVERKSVAKSFVTKGDAQKWARQQQVDMERGVFHKTAALQAITFGDLLERYIVTVLPGKRGYQQELYILRAWQLRALARERLQGITPQHIATARDTRLKEVSAGSVRRELDALSSVFSYACREWSLCDSNPVCAIRKPPHGRPRDRRLLPDEMERIILASQAPDFAAIVRLAYETAMRRGEILSLRWENIDLDRQVAYLPITKNGEARSVPLSRAACTLLLSLPHRSDGLVFHKNPTSLSGAFQRALQRARGQYVEECKQVGRNADSKFLVGVRFHDLRHEATTRFVEMGLSLLEVSAITGHKTLAMLKRYSHPSAELLAMKLG